MRNPCWPAEPPAFRMVTFAVSKWSPLEQAANGVEEDLSVFFMILNDEMETSPAEMPSLPEPTVVGFEAPQENEKISIFFSNPVAVHSPSTVAMSMKVSNAMTQSSKKIF